jgi:tetrahydromethanopterin S-methyltransferase subunit B
MRGHAGGTGPNGPGGTAALGTDAKYKHKAQKVDPDTGEVAFWVEGQLVRPVDPMESRMQRFILQSIVRSLLPESRTNNCLRVRQGSKQIQVLKSVKHGTTSYGGLQTCGSVWQCPVCAAKIAERRRVEVRAAMDAWKLQGGTVNLLTLTCPHQRSDDLFELLAKQAKALNYFWKDRNTKAVLVEMGNTGHIKATETTHGRLSPFDNGWHPHYHVLMFDGSGVDLALFDVQQMSSWLSRLYLCWLNACRLAGLGDPSHLHGIRLDDGSKADKYISKWGLEDEITRGHTKKAISGETPFDLLRAIQADPTDRQAAALFIEFATAFKGKRQLRWSKGLKARFAVEEKTDDEIADQKEDFAEVLGMLTIEQWRDVLAVEGRGPLLSIAARGGWSAVSDYLAQIQGRGVPKKRGNTSHPDG